MKIKFLLPVILVLAFILPTILFWCIGTFPLPASISQPVHGFLNRFFPDSSFPLTLKKANTLYETENFRQALTWYKTLESSAPEKKDILSHNTGNTYYRLGEQERETNKLNTYSLWNFAIQAYQHALSGQKAEQLRTPNSKKTQQNIVLVRKKLEELIQELKDE